MCVKGSPTSCAFPTWALVEVSNPTPEIMNNQTIARWSRAWYEPSTLLYLAVRRAPAPPFLVILLSCSIVLMLLCQAPLCIFSTLSAPDAACSMERAWHRGAPCRLAM